MQAIRKYQGMSMLLEIDLVEGVVVIIELATGAVVVVVVDDVKSSNKVWSDSISTCTTFMDVPAQTLKSANASARKNLHVLLQIAY